MHFNAFVLFCPYQLVDTDIHTVHTGLGAWFGPKTDLPPCLRGHRDGAMPWPHSLTGIDPQTGKIFLKIRGREKAKAS